METVKNASNVAMKRMLNRFHENITYEGRDVRGGGVAGWRRGSLHMHKVKPKIYKNLPTNLTNLVDQTKPSLMGL